MKCHKCKVEMKDGVVITNAVASSGCEGEAFAPHTTLMEVPGPGILVQAMKCPECGHSIALKKGDFYLSAKDEK